MTHLTEYVFQKKPGDLNLHVFNMITAKNESKILTKNISCKCNCRFDGKNVSQMNAGITINVYVSVKNTMYVKKIVFGILLHVVGKMENIMVDSAMICDEIIETYDEETKNISTNFNGKKLTCKMQKFYISLAFLLIAIVLLVAVIIYCYLIKYPAKQKHLLPFHNANNELKQVLY